MRPSLHDDGRDAETRAGCDRLERLAARIEGPLMVFAGVVLLILCWAFFAPRSGS